MPAEFHKGSLDRPDQSPRNFLELMILTGDAHTPRYNLCESLTSLSRASQFNYMESKSTELGRLIPCGGGDPISLSKPTILIGRRSSCDVVLLFPNVSSHHCQLELQNGYWFIRDLRSRNGIKVNGERVDSKFLHPGDTLSIAKHHFEIKYEPSADAPAPVEEDPFEMSLLEKAGLERRREQERRRELPRAVRPVSKQAEEHFSDDENQAMNWLMDDG